MTPLLKNNCIKYILKHINAPTDNQEVVMLFEFTFQLEPFLCTSILSLTSLL